MTHHGEAKNFTYIATSMREIATACGVSEQTSMSWYKLGKLERKKKGKTYEYDLLAAVRYSHGLKIEKAAAKREAKLQKQVEQLKTKLASATSQSMSVLEDLKIRRMELQLRSEELDYARECEELVPWSSVEQFLKLMATTMQSAGDLLRKHHGTAAQKIINDALKATRKNFASLWKRGMKG